MARPRPIILFFNTFFGDAPDLSALSSAERACFVQDRRWFREADAVVFHVPGIPHLEGLSKAPGQIWVAWSMESAANYPLLTDPAFLARIDLVMSYQRTADIWTPYMQDRSVWQEIVRRPLPTKSEVAPAVMLQSAAHDHSRRIAYARALMEAMAVDSYGRVLNNRQFPVADRGRHTKLETIARYKFYLAFENSIAPDYVTEKLFDPLLVGTVPIYLGAPNVDAFVPSRDAYINVRDFPEPRDLARHLDALAADEDAYRRFFDWRKRPLSPDFLALTELRQPGFRQLLKMVAKRRA
jgi:alpha-1,3-fucosyltransferase 10